MARYLYLERFAKLLLKQTLSAVREMVRVQHKECYINQSLQNIFQYFKSYDFMLFWL